MALLVPSNITCLSFAGGWKHHREGELLPPLLLLDTKETKSNFWFCNVSLNICGASLQKGESVKKMREEVGGVLLVLEDKYE